MPDGFEPDRDKGAVEATGAGIGRRSILKWTGAAAVGAFAFGSGLSSFSVNQAFAQRGAGGVGAVDLGEGDIGILNYAYALEQLEAAFYAQVMQTPYRGMNRLEQALLGSIGEHEIAHRDFLRGALGPAAIPDLQVNFSRIDFASRKSVLTTAKTFEDLGVAAYNGAGPGLSDPDHLAAAGSIVSIEARHAAVLRDLLAPGSAAFAGSDVVDRNGLDVASVPSRVLPKAAPFVATPISARSLP